MIHRPATLITFRLIVAMMRKGMTRKQVAEDLVMSEENVKMILYRIRKDRRQKPRTGSVDRRKDVPIMSPEENKNVA